MCRTTLLLLALSLHAQAETLGEAVDFVAAETTPRSASANAGFMASAAEEATKTKDWRVSITPYVWFTGFRVDTDSQQISADFGDVAALANSGFMVIAAVEWRRWSFGLDYTFADLSSDLKLDRATGTADFKQNILHVVLGYAVLDQGDMSNPTGVRLRVQVGARYWDTNVKVGLVIPPVLPGGEETRIDIDEGSDWWDLTTGVNARWVLNKKTAFRLWGNIGGFGIGESSDYTWEWGFVTSFLVTKWFGFHVGYRMLQYKRDSGGIDTNLTMQGPIIGFTFVW